MAVTVPAPPRNRPPVTSSDKLVRIGTGTNSVTYSVPGSALHPDDQDDAALLCRR